MQNPTDAKIKGVSVWFYIVAAFQVLYAVMTWNSYAGQPGLVRAATALVVLDVCIGVLFVVFGYYAAKKQAWAFVAGLVLYALRALLQLVASFNPVSLIIRAFLMFRIFQGLQACLAANQADQAMQALRVPRRLEMPQAPIAPPAAAWIPPRGTHASQPEGHTQ